MKLNELINRAAVGYPDAQLLEYWDSAHERPRNNRDGGDTLARFIVIEMAETFDPDASDEEQINEAVRVINRAIADMQAVIEQLLR